MKRNRLILLTTILLALVAVFLIFNNSGSTFKSSERDFAILDTSSVTKLFLADKRNNTILLERSSGKWKLNEDYVARREGVDILLQTMLNLAVREPVAKASRETILKWMSASSTKVEIYQNVYRINIFGLKLFQHEKLTKVYYVSNPTQDNTGTYMIMEDSDQPFVIHIHGFNGFLTARYATLLEEWRTHEIFRHKMNDVKSVSMEYMDSSRQSYKVINHGNQQFSVQTLDDNKTIEGIDTVSVIDFLSSFEDIRFEAFRNELDVKDSVLNSVPDQVIVLEDSEGQIIKLRTYLKRAPEGKFDVNGEQMIYDLDRFFAVINDDKDLILCQYYVFDKILRPFSYFKIQIQRGN